MHQPDTSPDTSPDASSDTTPAAPAAPMKPAAARPRTATKPAVKTAAPKKVAAKQATATVATAKVAAAKKAAAPKAALSKHTPSAAPVAREGSKRAKLVRDSFTMPQPDFALIDVLKARALGIKRPTKKSELLRAGLQALAAMPVAELKATLGRLMPLKTGRPKKAG